MSMWSKVDGFEYGRTGLMGWAQEHAMVCAVGALIGWLAIVYAVLTTVFTVA